MPDRRAQDAHDAAPHWRRLDDEPQSELIAPEHLLGGLSRRGFLGLMGAGLTLAGCQGGLPEKLLPYGITPKELTPGSPQHYATSMVLDGWATGLIVESHDGRPTKIEGNPDHPASLGAAGPFEQAAVLQLYDPHRARGLRHHGRSSTWDALRNHLVQPRRDQGAGLRLLLPPTTSPLWGALLGRVLDRAPRARVCFYAPLDGESAAGAQLAFGRPAQVQYDLSRADVVVAFDADFLAALGGFSLRYARQWSARRDPAGSPLRLFMAEPALSVTGSMADERLRCGLSALPAIALALVAELARRRPGLFGPALDPAPLSPERAAWVRAAARDLLRAGSAGLVIVGERAPRLVHALAHLVNGALGSTATWTTAPMRLDLGAASETFPELCAELHSGAVDTLIMTGVNPVYDAPVDLDFAGGLAKVRDSVFHSLYENETAEHATWFVPALHFLESWDDARAYDGTLSIVQPLVRPLFAARGTTELLAVIAGEPTPIPYALVHDRWVKAHPGVWERALSRGLLEDSAAPRLTAPVDREALTKAAEAHKPPSLELTFAPDYSVYDGRFGDIAWLQELPRPLTSLTWDNAALMSPATAQRLGVTDGDRVELSAGGHKVMAPVLRAPGHADEAISVTLGYGRAGGEVLARGVGFTAYPLRTTKSLWHTPVGLRKLSGPRYPLARTQLHHDVEGRPIALATTLAQYRREPGKLTAEHKGPVPTLLPSQLDGGLQWAMSIDLGRCTGCNSCVVACQAENNISVVGKLQVMRGRQMHWIRIDTYYSGTPESPGVVHQPMLCQHCEKAPCEYVCPVNATVHSPEGLNEMVYNRCVGTRFCSNNCPYKVRRFNWVNWEAKVEANQGSVALQRNPDVTVRARGVMEKCSYCVQRIRAAEIRANVEKRPVAPDEFQVACQQACPTRAIEFGSLSHPKTAMVRYRQEPRSYGVLHDQGTQPRTQYLVRVDNPAEPA